MTERPILFSGSMVRAILDGTKSQTRRVVKPQTPFRSVPPSSLGNGRWLFEEPNLNGIHTERMSVACPYGQPGDRLWVREKWSADPPIDDSWASTEWNGCGRKVREIPERFHHPRFCNYAADWLHEPIRWTPSIHMPRWASRILLEIESVRVERLNAISADDARDEGIDQNCDGGCAPKCNACNEQDVDTFRRLWESINGPGSWAANPWVWCVSFRRIAQ